MAGSKTNKKGSSATLGFEETLWLTADKQRGSMDASEYKHVVLGLIFLKYISDTFTELRAKLEEDEYSDPDDQDEYLAENVFWVPEEARWDQLQANAKSPKIGIMIDDAMRAIETAEGNDKLKGVLSKDFGRESLNKTMLGELIDLISTIGLGDAESKSKDILGRVYEYFLGQFAGAEGKSGGEFYTPQSVVRLLVEMLEPYKGRVYDPCCGSGGMFVQSEKFVEEHGGRIGDLAVYGQEMNHTTWRLAQMNMAVRGIDADIKWNNEGSFHRDELQDLKADFILANPPFNISDWGGDKLKEDVRWKYGTPPSGNANFAWLQHIIHHLAPRGTAGVVLANGSMSSQAGGEGDIRKALIDGDLVDCMVALPGQLFYSTQIPVCLWFLTRFKEANGFKNRQKEILFIDARKMGHLVDRTRREFTAEDMAKISDTYHAWRGEEEAIERRGEYEDVPGFCKTADYETIKKADFVMTPGRYVGTEAEADDGIPFEEKIKDLRATLKEQFAIGTELEESIRQVLGGDW